MFIQFWSIHCILFTFFFQVDEDGCVQNKAAVNSLEIIAVGSDQIESANESEYCCFFSNEIGTCSHYLARISILLVLEYPL